MATYLGHIQITEDVTPPNIQRGRRDFMWQDESTSLTQFKEKMSQIRDVDEARAESTPHNPAPGTEK